MPADQKTYWILTIPHHAFVPFLHTDVAYLRGQLETGAGGYLHWQLLCVLRKKATLRAVKDIYGRECHAEPSRSAAADDYVWKEETRVAGTQFELGKRAFKRNSDTDWDAVRADAAAGKLDAIPSNVFVQHYHSLKRIQKDYSVAVARPGTTCVVFWGATGTGKSHRAWAEAGDNCYIKSPSTKWWDGYRGEENVLIDEFTGQIGITNLLRWIDKYPCRVEEKGGDQPLKAIRFWICSNTDPREWYSADQSPAVQNAIPALMRRIQITHFNAPFGQ